MTIFNKKLVADEDSELMAQLAELGADEPYAETDGIRVAGPHEPSDITITSVNGMPSKPDEPKEKASYFAFGPDADPRDVAKAKGTGAIVEQALRSAKAGVPSALGRKPPASSPAGAAVARPESPSAPPRLDDEGPPMREAQDLAPPTPRTPDELETAQDEAARRRNRNSFSSAASFIGHAGLKQPSDRGAYDARRDEEANSGVGELMARRKEGSRQLSERQGTESHDLQQQTGKQNLSKQYEDMVRQRDYNSEASPVSQRRRAEAFGLYPKEIGRIPPDVWERASAADVDVILKELNMQKDRAATGARSAAQDKAFAEQVRKLGEVTGKLPYGEVENLAQRFEQRSPGITSGQYKGEDPLGGTLNRGLMALPGGIGEGLADSKSLETNNMVKEATDLIERMRSGAVINDAEARHYKSLIGSGVTQDGAALSRGLNTVFSSLRAKLHNTQSGYNYLRNDKGQSPLDVVSGEGGTDARRPFGAPRGGAPAQQARGKPYKGPDGHWYIDE